VCLIKYRALNTYNDAFNSSTYAHPWFWMKVKGQLQSSYSLCRYKEGLVTIDYPKSQCGPIREHEPFYNTENEA
jgi:hypothetical protein